MRIVFPQNFPQGEQRTAVSRAMDYKSLQIGYSSNASGHAYQGTACLGRRRYPRIF